MTEESGTALAPQSARTGHLFPSPDPEPAVQISLQDVESIRLAVASAGDVTYQWDIGTDLLSWSNGADAILRRPAAALLTGKHYAALLDPENLTSRYDAVTSSTGSDEGQGVPYHIEYRLKADPDNGFSAMWVEDRGRWFGDRDGRPSHAVGVVRPIDDRHSRDQHLSQLSHTDPLTGMMNRARLDEALEESIGEAKNNETTCAFAIAAIRNLEVVNEAYGFEVADEVIAALAERLRAVMRTGDGIARYSGGKFGFILNNCSAADLPVALERFLNVSRDSVIETSHGPVWALLSVGAVLLPEHAASAAAARALAEEALSVAIRLPSDSYVIHQPSELNSSSRMVNARCAAEIVQCLKSNTFQLAFQPLIDAQTGAVACHEALLRMRDSSGEIVTAGHLIPVAERLGLIRLVDRSVVQLALETLHRHADACLSINLSATTANDPRWNSQIIEMIEMAGNMAQRLTVEIAETSALMDLTSAIAFLERLRNTGCCVAIDDFGSGFTSFRNLRDLPVDIIKLDGSYCRNLVKDSENVYFVRTLVEMAHHFGIRTVAEWVETESDAEILRSLGVDFLQGNYLGRPDMEAPWAETAAASFSFGETAVAAVAPPPAVSDAPPAEPEAVGHPVAAEEQVQAEVVAAEAAEQPLVAEDTPPAAEQAEAIAPLAEEEQGQAPVADSSATEAEGHVADPVDAGAGEGHIVELDSEVDESLMRLRAALDNLTREIAAEERSANENGETVRLAG